MDILSAIIGSIEGIRLPSVSEESDIHALIANAFSENGLVFSHEKRLSCGLRPDFMVGSIAVEVKKNKPSQRMLLRQIESYLSCDEITEIVVVSQRHIKLPQTICGKSVHSVFLDCLWGVSLP